MRSIFPEEQEGVLEVATLLHPVDLSQGEESLRGFYRPIIKEIKAKAKPRILDFYIHCTPYSSSIDDFCQDFYDCVASRGRFFIHFVTPSMEAWESAKQQFGDDVDSNRQLLFATCMTDFASGYDDLIFRFENDE